MFKKKEKILRVVDVKTLTALVEIEDGSFSLRLEGQCFGDIYREADEDMFFSRRVKGGFLRVNNDEWIPISRVKSIKFKIEPNLVKVDEIL